MINLDNHYCPNEACELYGRTGLGNIRDGWQYGKNKTWMLRCKNCNTRFSERTGTFFHGLRSEEDKILRTLKLLAEGNGIRATARIMEISTNTVKDWLGRAGEHVEEVSDYLMKDLHVEECQLDELWSFIKKRKERRSIHGK
jgi:transposase-like protein